MKPSNAVALGASALVLACNMESEGPKGTRDSLEPVRFGTQQPRKHIMLPRSTTQPQYSALSSADITVYWHGGSVISYQKVAAIYWSNQTIYNGGPAPGTYGAGSADGSVVGAFLTHLGGSPYYKINSTDAFVLFGNCCQFWWFPVSNSVTYSQYWAPNTNVPAPGSSVSDASVRNEVVGGFTSGTLTFDGNTVYMVFSDAGVNLGGGFTGTRGSYCAYHSHFSWNGNDVKYAVMPHAYDFHSAPFGYTCDGLQGSPNNDPAADAEINTAAHEIEETNTDPDLNGFYDDGTGYENADLCAYNYGSTYSTANGAQANMNLGGRDYLVQQNWISARGPCAQAVPLTAYLSGWNKVIIDWPSSCSWSASAFGTSPISYAWYRDGNLVSTESTYSANYIYYGFTLVLDVSDSQGHLVADTQYIAINQNQNDLDDRCIG